MKLFYWMQNARTKNSKRCFETYATLQQSKKNKAKLLIFYIYYLIEETVQLSTNSINH